ncbi:MAG: hypothetical protein K2L91_10925 [Duncaniella sp.]|nr:hypothetical protein [Duncaniella sp.]MDE6465749.1 hypothetical protein [Duncaniella sp.]
MMECGVGMQAEVFTGFLAFPLWQDRSVIGFLEVTSSPAPAVAGDVRGRMENVEAAVSPFI